MSSDKVSNSQDALQSQVPHVFNKHSSRRRRSPLSQSKSPSQSTDQPLLGEDFKFKTLTHKLALSSIPPQQSTAFASLSADVKILTNELALCRQEILDLQQHVDDLEEQLEDKRDADRSECSEKGLEVAQLKGFVAGLVMMLKLKPKDDTIMDDLLSFRSRRRGDSGL